MTVTMTMTMTYAVIMSAALLVFLVAFTARN